MYIGIDVECVLWAFFLLQRIICRKEWWACINKNTASLLHTEILCGLFLVLEEKGSIHRGTLWCKLTSGSIRSLKKEIKIERGVKCKEGNNRDGPINFNIWKYILRQLYTHNKPCFKSKYLILAAKVPKFDYICVQNHTIEPKRLIIEPTAHTYNINVILHCSTHSIDLEKIRKMEWLCLVGYGYLIFITMVQILQNKSMPWACSFISHLYNQSN
jgi:hypothetical protein